MNEIEKLNENTFIYINNNINYITSYNNNKNCLNVLKEPEENDKLRQKSFYINNITNILKIYLQEYLLNTMYIENGIGIASIQCGIPIRVFIIDIPIIKKINNVINIEKNNPRYVREAILKNKKLKVLEKRPIYKNYQIDSYEIIEKYYGFENIIDQNVIETRAVEIDEVVEIERNPVFVINPQIENISEESIVITEGCLSVPLDYTISVFGSDTSVSRPIGIEITYTNIDGEIERIHADGTLGDHEKWLARCIQHEYDHLEGILFIDKLYRPTNE